MTEGETGSLAKRIEFVQDGKRETLKAEAADDGGHISDDTVRNEYEKVHKVF